MHEAPSSPRGCLGNEFQVDLQVCQKTKQIPKCFTYALEHTIDALGGDHV